MAGSDESVALDVYDVCGDVALAVLVPGERHRARRR
jgi:hypothetical protein